MEERKKKGKLRDRKKKNGRYYLAAAGISAALVLFFHTPLSAGAENFYPASRKNVYNYLQTPTQAVKIADTYYLTDCYHNQVIYSKSIGAPLNEWSVMAGNLCGPHAVAGDGEAYLIVDTENDRVIGYRKRADGFSEQQIFEHIGKRPHYAKYDPETGNFYVWSSMTGEMYVFRRENGGTELYLEKVMSVPELMGKYVRSFTIDGGAIYLPCVVESCIYVADKETLQVLAAYPVPYEAAGMIQLTRTGGSFYLTVSTDLYWNAERAAILRADSLEDLSAGRYENVSGLFAENGTPYYIERFDGAYYTPVLTQDGRPGIYRFIDSPDGPKEVRRVCG